MDFSGHRQDEQTKKAVGILAVVEFHAALVYALLNGLGTHIAAALKELPITVAIIDEVKPPPPPPPPPPKMVREPPKSLAPPPPAYVPAPEVKVAPSVAPAITATTTEKPLAPVLPSSTAQPVVGGKAAGSVTVGAVTDFSSCESPEYPPSSKRNDERGTVTIAFLIGVDGRVADSRIEKTSKYPALDRAARKALSLCHFKPGTVDGQPVQSWTSVAYVWTIKDD